MSETRPTRTAAEIEADLARTRSELTATVNELSDRLNPRTQLNAAKESARAAAADFSTRAREMGDRAAGGDPTALAIVAGVIATAAGVVIGAVLRRKR